MINNIAKYLTDKLFFTGSITEDEQELYIYGFFMLLSNLMYLILACLLGLILNCIFESIVFYIAFQFIRRYAGGYHASTEIRCEILSTFSIVVSIVMIKLLKTYDLHLVLFITSIISAACIFCFCPLDTPEKPLSEKEFRYFRKISRLVLLIIVSAVIISYFKLFRILFAPCCLSLILECILIVAGKIKKTVQKSDKKHHDIFI